jgi:hypothetical protein
LHDVLRANGGSIKCRDSSHTGRIVAISLLRPDSITRSVPDPNSTPHDN